MVLRAFYGTSWNSACVCLVFDVVCRVYGLIEELKRNYSGKNVLLVCHGGICRIIETYYRDMTREEFAGFFMGNCELRCFEIKEES